MRLVTIDNGNTNPTVALYKGETLEKVFPFLQYQKQKDDFILISSVGKALDIKASFDLKNKRSQTHFFDMKVDYAETLGEDRLVASYYLYNQLKPNEKILLIDAGTFITCDLISNFGFLGGYIFPGVDRFLETYSQSHQLPLLDKAQLEKTTPHLPHTTNEAILSATKIYLKTTIEELVNKNAPDKIVFTGGTSKIISDLINLKVQSETVHHLVHLGLSLIYQNHLSQE
jgi:type III pantothenate kinase